MESVVTHVKESPGLAAAQRRGFVFGVGRDLRIG